MKINSTHLLEQYIIGKDQDRHQILLEIYNHTAKVKFEIRSNTISFPENVVGHREIAKVLSADFNMKYERVKTYYLWKPDSNLSKILKQPWLVVMKERGDDITRIGTGYYDWIIGQRGNSFKIMKHKIYIHTMLEIQDTQSFLLDEIQKKLQYPWTDCSQAVEVLQNHKNLMEVSKYLINEF